MKTRLLAVWVLFSSVAAFAGENATTTAPATAVQQALPPAEETTGSIQEEVYVRRFSSITEMGSTIAKGQGYFSVYQAVGIRVNPHVFIGEGIGIQTAPERGIQVQLLTDLRVYALDRKVTPVFLVQAGMNKGGNGTFSQSEKERLGDTQLNINAGAGVMFKARPNAAFTLNGGYSLYSDMNRNLHAAFVKIGYVF